MVSSRRFSQSKKYLLNETSIWKSSLDTRTRRSPTMGSERAVARAGSAAFTFSP